VNGRRLGIIGATLVLGGVLLIGTGAALASQRGSDSSVLAVSGGTRTGMMGRGGFAAGAGMMGSRGTGTASPGPGEAGFAAGTESGPRVVRIAATAGLRFVPDFVRVQAGETIRFEVTAAGPTTHEFMVGPATDVAADTAGTPEVADITMMETASLTYTFTGSGPFAYACHAPGHYEAGMTGTIVVV
jgi:plastocyanin